MALVAMPPGLWPVTAPCASLVLWDLAALGGTGQAPTPAEGPGGCGCRLSVCEASWSSSATGRLVSFLRRGEEKERPLWKDQGWQVAGAEMIAGGQAGQAADARGPCPLPLRPLPPRVGPPSSTCVALT